jgi:hypothetical protein
MGDLATDKQQFCKRKRFSLKIAMSMMLVEQDRYISGNVYFIFSGRLTHANQRIIELHAILTSKQAQI